MPDDKSVHRDLHLANPLLKGADITELQKAVNKIADELPNCGLDKVHVDGEFGSHTASAAGEASYALGIRTDIAHKTSVTEHEQKVIRDPSTRSDAAKNRAAIREKELASRHTLHTGIRAKILEYCEWGVAHEPEIHYSHARPVPFSATDKKTLPFYTDCSGFATAAYHYAGAPDPNGTGYDGEAYTGLELNHLPTIPQAQARKGDLVLFDNSHVVVLAEDGGAVSDPICYSHGQESGPAKYRVSVEASAHAGQPVIYKKGF